ncbi:hypothetical protein GBAR_LOCUS29791, partial [Geodia barretti]
MVSTNTKARMAATNSRMMITTNAIMYCERRGLHMAQAPMIPIDATTIVMIPPTSSRA